MEEFEYTLDNEQQFWDGKLTPTVAVHAHLPKD